MFTEIKSDLSCIYGRKTKYDTCREYSRLVELITQPEWKAEYKRILWCGLPHKEEYLNGNSNVEDNKPDTYKCLQAAEDISSRIYRYLYNNAKDYGNRFFSCHKVVHSLSTKSPNGNKQAAKTIRTLNVTSAQPRDLTASITTNVNMRRRSFHSSASTCTKGNSITSPRVETLDSNLEKPVNKVKPAKVAKRVGVTTMVRKLLEQNKVAEQKYYKIMKIIADPKFLVACYDEIRSKQGNMTRGIDETTLDGINYEWFEKTAEELWGGKFKFKPNRRVEIPKANGKSRPLGVGSSRDKIVQKALHAVLEAIFEPLFLPSSHGFRPNRSTHSALLKVYLAGNKHNWVIQGDITKCFDSIPHSIIMKRISAQIGDPAFLSIISKFLDAGYIDPNTGKLIRSDLGAPQGGILSPILSNIVLHEFDKYMAKHITSFSKGRKRRWNPVYKSLLAKRGRSKSPEEKLNLLRQMRTMRSADMFDPGFIRMEYVRYADDFVILVTGSLRDAGYIKSNVKDFIKTNCGLDLNTDKTVISNIATEKWKFIGAEMSKIRINADWLVHHGNSRIVGTPMLQVNAPIADLIKSLKKVGIVRQNLKQDVLPQCLTSMVNLSHYEIVKFYNSKIHGITNYYSFASNRNDLHSVVWLLKASCALTLARKYKLGTLSKTFSKFGRDLECPDTGVSLIKPALRALHEFKTGPVANVDESINTIWSGKLTKSSFGLSCAICGSTTNLEMHHYRSIADVRAKYRKGDSISFAQFQGALLRKQIPLCEYHHKLYHKGDLTSYELKRIAGYRETENLSTKSDSSD